jgi:hypothetical protein
LKIAGVAGGLRGHAFRIPGIVDKIILIERQSHRTTFHTIESIISLVVDSIPLLVNLSTNGCGIVTGVIVLIFGYVLRIAVFALKQKEYEKGVATFFTIDVFKLFFQRIVV